MPKATLSYEALQLDSRRYTYRRCVQAQARRKLQNTYRAYREVYQSFNPFK